MVLFEGNLEIRQDGLHLQILSYELAKFDGMRLKIEGALILCVVAVLAKTCLEKFTPKLRRTSYNFISGKNSRSSYLANYKTYRKTFCFTRKSFNVYLLSGKIPILKF